MKPSNFFPKELNVQSIFQAQGGSEILFHTGSEWPICTYYDPSVPFLKQRSPLASSASEIEHTIELSFIQNNKFRIFPNPTTGKSIIDLYDPSLQKIPLQVLNVYGELISSFKISNEQSIDLTNLSKGVYFIIANIKNERVIQKLIIN